jgi:hypothetical protein
VRQGKAGSNLRPGPSSDAAWWTGVSGETKRVNSAVWQGDQVMGVAAQVQRLY